MLAYAANRPVVGKAPSSPSAMLLIISAHVALIAAVMSAKMELPRLVKHQNPKVVFVPTPPPPPPLSGSRTPSQHRSTFTDPDQQVATRPLSDARPSGGQTIDPGPIALGGGATFPSLNWSIPQPVHRDPRLLTPADELKPPYPESKLLSEEEATLHLRLAIDESGRVTAVEPIGIADRVFLEAARRYLIAHWRYQPASEDGRAVASSVTISLRFELNG